MNTIQSLVYNALNGFCYQTAREIESTIKYQGFRIDNRNHVAVVLRKMYLRGKIDYCVRDRASYSPKQYIRVQKGNGGN